MRSGQPPSPSNTRSTPKYSGKFSPTMRSSPPQPRRSDNSRRTVSIIATGSYVPERILTNQELEQIVDTTDEWIRTRTGIRERRIAAPDEATSDMATKAHLPLLSQADVKAQEIDLIIVATV